MKKHITRRHQDPEEGSAKKFIKSILTGTACSILTAVILSLVFSAVALAFGDPNAPVIAFSLSALIIASFLGGFVALKLNSSSALACGLITGALLLLLCVFCTFIFPGENSSSSAIGIIAFRVAIPVSSLAGAYIGLSKPKKKKRGK